MSIPSIYAVRPIKKHECREWLLLKHYAKRMPSVSYAFGLYNETALIGVITFGMTANSNLNEFIKGFQCIELNRLCVNDDLPKNVLSFFVGNALRLLPSPVVVISYADTGQGHHGYIYQATNWIYTGLGKGDYEFIKDGRQFHRKNLFDLFGSGNLENAKENGYEVVKVAPKHRYIMLLGDKRARRTMKALLPFTPEPYPKGDNKRYDASYEPITQSLLFG